jgi:hypothetical protein
MKKTIEIEILEKFPGMVETNQEENKEFDPRKQAAERKALALANAITKRTGKTIVDVSAMKQGKVGKENKEGVSVELDLTQKQIDKLPIGLRKHLK